MDSVTDDEAHLRLDAEDDEYIYDDDIIMEEQSDEMDDSDVDKEEHFPESDKVYQTMSAPVMGAMENYSSDDEEEEEDEDEGAGKHSKSEPKELKGATAMKATKNKSMVRNFD